MTPKFHKELELHIGSFIINCSCTEKRKRESFVTIFPELSFCRGDGEGLDCAPTVLTLKINSSRRVIYIDVTREDAVREHLNYYQLDPILEGFTSECKYQTCQSCESYLPDKGRCKAYRIHVAKNGVCKEWSAGCSTY